MDWNAALAAIFFGVGAKITRGPEFVSTTGWRDP